VTQKTANNNEIKRNASDYLVTFATRKLRGTAPVEFRLIGGAQCTRWEGVRAAN